MRAEFKERGGKGRVTQLGRILTQSVKNVDKIGRELVKSNSDIYYKALMTNILGQRLSWRPLTPYYKSYKGVLGLDSRILIATGEYVANINIRELPNRGGKLRYHVGVDQNASHSDGINMGILSLVMEYGTADGRVPARPHFGPTWNQVKNQVRNNTLSYGRRIWQLSR